MVHQVCVCVRVHQGCVSGYIRGMLGYIMGVLRYIEGVLSITINSDIVSTSSHALLNH